MNIQFNRVMPFPLASISHGADSIWGNSAQLESGKKILLNASSGKGKSTFSMTVFGIRKDYDGTILYDGRDIKTFSVDEWVVIRQRKISTVFQDLQLFHKLTVAENLQLKNQLTHFKSETEIKNMLAELEIDHKWNDPCGLLSMGQQQRVAIVRSLCQPFNWLILDEPFSHLDERNSLRCLSMIDAECTRQKAGFVLTSLDDDNRFSYDYELKL
ncbi:ATP-binding cassette domain-containing protein [uncultured Fluviicola sp.]|uniref:ABC transporter ATP-binding protein n=1 Tax=uncultured Fluviicola sp. TaxID=463303 RepID=UPI0025E39B4D|nr:ATP-binding cassette domain-containing protein [uncultured Fluviicola sp.]